LAYALQACSIWAFASFDRKVPDIVPECGNLSTKLRGNCARHSRLSAAGTAG
jgi:hypothetical protein